MAEPKKRGRGRPRHEPTPETHEQAATLYGLGLSQEAVARRLGIDDVTLRKYYADDLHRGLDSANLQVGQSILYSATGREVQDDGTIKRIPVNATLAIWWSKTRMGWKDPEREKVNPDIVPTQISAPGATVIIRGGLPPDIFEHQDDTDPDVPPPRTNGHGGNGSTPPS